MPGVGWLKISEYKMVWLFDIRVIFEYIHIFWGYFWFAKDVKQIGKDYPQESQNMRHMFIARDLSRKERNILYSVITLVPCKLV